MTIICPECQTENEENAGFCKKCGVNLGDVPLSNSDDVTENKLARKLFYWHDEKTDKYRLAKSKIISEISFLIGFIYGIIFYFVLFEIKYSFFIAITASIVLGLLLAVPVFVIGFLVHKFLS